MEAYEQFNVKILFFAKNFIFILVIFSFQSHLNLLKSESISEINRESLNNNLTIDYFQKNKSSKYIIGPGDRLNIIISRDYPELTRQVSIDINGRINLEKVKDIYVEGLSLEELAILLNKAYKEFILYPETEIEIKSYRNIKTFVKGEVDNPGYQILKGALITSSEKTISQNKILNNSPNKFYPTVFDAIRSAGGITRYSDLSKVNIYRINSISNGGGILKTTLNFKTFLNNGNFSQNIRIYDGDIIEISRLDKADDQIVAQAVSSRLNKKFIDVFISGRINNSGRLQTSRSSTLNDAIDLAGGIKLLRGKIKFIRFKNDGNIMQRNFRYSKKAKRGSYSNPFLINGDIIYVEDNILTNSTEFITEITSPFSSAFSAYGLFKAITD